ncbi:hypothetical protein AB6C40_14990 [Vibrio splendidus]
MKNLIAISTLLVLSWGATAKTVSFDDVSESVRSTCPTCLAAGQPIMEVLNEQCGKPYTLETWDEVSQKSGVYAFMMALNNVSQDMQPLFERAMRESVTCNDDDLWIKKTKTLIESEKYQRQMALLIEQQVS